MIALDAFDAVPGKPQKTTRVYQFRGRGKKADRRDEQVQREERERPREMKEESSQC